MAGFEDQKSTGKGEEGMNGWLKRFIEMERKEVYNRMMSKTVKAQPPSVELATKDWTLKELMDTERRIEKAFHDQTQFLSEKNDAVQNMVQEQGQFLSGKNDDIKKEIATQTRWMMGLIITMTIAIIVAVLFKG